MVKRTKTPPKRCLPTTRCWEWADVHKTTATTHGWWKWSKGDSGMKISFRRVSARIHDWDSCYSPRDLVLTTPVWKTLHSKRNTVFKGKYWDRLNRPSYFKSCYLFDSIYNLYSSSYMICLHLEHSRAFTKKNIKKPRLRGSQLTLVW